MIGLSLPKYNNKVIKIFLVMIVFLVACSPLPTSSPTPVLTPTASGQLIREAETADEITTGDKDNIWRSNASDQMVLGQFGCEGDSPYAAKPGYAKYIIEKIPRSTHLYLVVRFSKDTPAIKPIEVYIDDETEPRASFYPTNQDDWNKFAETERLDLGSIEAGDHILRFQTVGQQYGVADLDKFTLTGE